MLFNTLLLNVPRLKQYFNSLTTKIQVMEIFGFFLLDSLFLISSFKTRVWSKRENFVPKGLKNDGINMTHDLIAPRAIILGLFWASHGKFVKKINNFIKLDKILDARFTRVSFRRTAFKNLFVAL